MRKAAGHRLQVTVIIATFVLLFLLPTACCLPPIRAAESSPSSDIKSKLEELKKEIASKAAKLKQEVNKKLKDKAYVGKVKHKSDSSLTLAASSGPKIVSINQDTEYESQLKTKRKFSLKNISEEDSIVALGDIDETGVLTAKKVILLNPIPSTLIPKTYLWGQVIAISERLVTVKNRENKNVAVSLPNQSSVKLNDFVILVGNLRKNEIFEADFVYVIPQGGFIKPKKIATPSAKVTTPSAKPKSPTR